jgi:hypothetical protein
MMEDDKSERPADAIVCNFDLITSAVNTEVGDGDGFTDVNDDGTDTVTTTLCVYLKN